jgi:signal transduction histidine kinase
VTAADGAVTADVADDGHGIEVTARRSGLENLRVRAERLGGSFRIDTGARGTRAHWSVPVPASPEE